MAELFRLVIFFVISVHMFRNSVNSLGFAEWVVSGVSHYSKIELGLQGSYCCTSSDGINLDMGQEKKNSKSRYPKLGWFATKNKQKTVILSLFLCAASRKQFGDLIAMQAELFHRPYNLIKSPHAGRVLVSSGSSG